MRTHSGGRGCAAQGVRHTRRGEGAFLARPEAVEGVAVVCAVARRWLWILCRFSCRVCVGGCCGCLNGGEVVRGGGVLPCSSLSTMAQRCSRAPI